jgi:hypothetical protein
MAAGWDPAADAWLSGFADGEGCFAIRSRSCGDGTVSYSPLFAIWLRADDAPVLRELHARFGGSFSFRGKQSANYGGRQGGKPQFGWQVTSRAGLLALVGYFDRFPLRSKKAADYALWREAVRIYCAGRSSRWERNQERHEALGALRDAIREGRQYDAAEEIAELERRLVEVPDGH